VMFSNSTLPTPARARIVLREIGAAYGLFFTITILNKHV